MLQNETLNHDFETILQVLYILILDLEQKKVMYVMI